MNPTSHYEEALERLAGSTQLFADMAAHFVKDAPAFLETIRTHAQSTHTRGGEADEVRRAAHSLKGLAATIGARLQEELARKIEHDPNAAEETLAALEENLASLRPALQAYVETHRGRA